MVVKNGVQDLPRPLVRSVTENFLLKLRLFSFRTGKGVGYSAHFSGPMLVIESAVRSTKREIRYVRHLVGHQFHPQKVHTIIYHLMKNPFFCFCYNCIVWWKEKIFEIGEVLGQKEKN